MVQSSAHEIAPTAAQLHSGEGVVWTVLLYGVVVKLTVGVVVVVIVLMTGNVTTVVLIAVMSSGKYYFNKHCYRL